MMRMTLAMQIWNGAVLRYPAKADATQCANTERFHEPQFEPRDSLSSSPNSARIVPMVESRSQREEALKFTLFSEEIGSPHVGSYILNGLLGGHLLNRAFL